MGAFEIGVVLPLTQFGPERVTPRWAEIREVALRLEGAGVDTLWVPDELVWYLEGKPPMGVWDGVSMLGAVAAVTSRATVGAWVLSALHRNPGIIAKTVETLDEISGGRFIFGLGAGHAWPGQAHAFGLPEDHVFDRFGEALAVIVPLLREGRAEYEGAYHAARGLVQQPQGPRPGRIPLMVGGNGPKAMRHAVRHAEVWSCYAEEGGTLDEFAPRLAALDAICADEGRDPSSMGRSAGIDVSPLAASADELAKQVRALRDGGFTRVELMVNPGTLEAFEALCPVIELVHGDAA